MALLNRQSLYINSGNAAVLGCVKDSDRRILDIGCGAGNTGRLIRTHYPNSIVAGVTCSQSEFEQASTNLDRCFYLDVERDSLEQIGKDYDLLLFSHVLEHLVDPVAVIQRLLPCLKPNGRVVIVVPNIANWRERWKLALGRFEYADSGIMDRTHLHFYTFHTAPSYLVATIPSLKLEYLGVNGSLPLGFLRHHFLNENTRQRIDRLGCQIFPNFCGGEILMVASYFNGFEL
jgi:2-polyprenyl-3-methyl-5-hydroxy-6-metoxy-1,4-benzoquinol methylase